MFRPAALFIGLRYLRAKRRNHFISFISLTSMLGIALGVTALITVLSVMNGFDEEIHKRVFGMARQVTVSTMSGVVHHWQNIDEQVKKYPGVIATAPVITNQVLLTNNGLTHPAVVEGILPDRIAKLSEVGSKMVRGQLSDLIAGRYGIVIGEELANSLGLNINDTVTVFTPQVTVTPADIVPRFKRFTVIGVFKVGNGFGYDTNLGFIHLKDAQTLFQFGDGVSGIQLKLNDVYAAPRISQDLSEQLPLDFQITNWTQEFGELFQVIKLEKTMMFVLLLLIIAVAAFNLVSMLVVVVSEKKSDIAILRTFGATPLDILTTFMVQGTVLGVIGVVLGLIGGVLLSLNITTIVAAIEHYFHIQLLSSSVYYVNYLPSKLAVSDVVNICGAALFMSLIATIYPAWRAARTQPAEALRYE